MGAMKLSIESAQYDHYQAILNLNEAAVPAVNSLELADLERLALQACYFKVALVEDEVVGFLLMLAAGAQYKSLNYAWFSENYTQFAYIDRIVINPFMSGKGVGRQFYLGAIDALVEKHIRLCCEVNIKPLNKVSLAFHEALGFVEVGQQDTENGSKRVSLLLRE